MFEKLVVVTRKTRLEELIQRFNTPGQAKFYIERNGGDFAEYQVEHDRYQRAHEALVRLIPAGLKVQHFERALVPTFQFSASDLVVTMGQDGLVANTAKYVGAQPIIAVNPDPLNYDGVLLPFLVKNFTLGLQAALEERYACREVTLARVTLNDKQSLLAFNDLFIGAASHVSARYRVRLGGLNEAQSSSGIIVSTGAGSTGWLSSIFNMTAGVARAFGGREPAAVQLAWDDPRLVFAVREPFQSKHSSAKIVAGFIENHMELVIESQMPSGGVIFSDGVEQDFLTFNSGFSATIKTAEQRARLIVPPPGN